MARVRKCTGFSFQTKVLLPVFGFLVVLPGLTLFVIDLHIASQTRIEAEDTLDTAQAVFNNSLRIRERHLRMRLENAVNEPRLKSTVMLGDPETTKAFLLNTLSEYAGEVEVLHYTPADGSPSVSVVKQDGLTQRAFEYGAQLGIEIALGGDTYSSLIIADAQLFEVISVPVFISNGFNLVGVLSLGSHVGKRTLEELKSLARTEVLVLADDQPVASTLSETSERQFMAALFSREDSAWGGLHPVEISGEHFHYLFSKIDRTDNADEHLRFALLSSYESRLKALGSTRRTLLGMSGLGIFVSIFIIWILIRNITRPLRALRDGAEAVGRGDYSRRVEVRSRDECGELALAFNRMVGKVQQAREALEGTVGKLKMTQGHLVQREASLRESEEGLRLIIEGARDHAIFTLDDTGAVARWNSASEQMLGYLSDEASATDYGSFFDGDDRDRGVPARLLNLARTTGRAEFEGWRIRKDGTRFWADVTLSRLTKVSGSEDGGFVEIARDITARKQVEEAVRQARDAAEASDRAKSEFLANMSHEVRTPMNGIIGMSSLLLDQDVSAEQKEFIETIRSSADSMLLVLDDILDISKIESGQFDVEIAPVHLVQLIEESVGFLADDCDAKNVGLYICISDRVPGVVDTDASRLRKALLNVVGNAVKFTDEGCIQVEVDFDPQTECLRIDVSDTGIGIPADKIDQIFHPFYQVEQSLSRRYGGTGLGLAIARNIAELLGGEISVESTLVRGSRFTLTVKASADEQSLSLQRFDDRKVLVVADDVASRSAMIRQLAAWGIRIEGGSSEQFALGDECEIQILEAANGPDEVVSSPLDETRRAIRIAARRSSDPASGTGPLRLARPVLPSRLNLALKELLDDPETRSEATENKTSRKPKTFNYDPHFAMAYPLKILVVEDNAINLKVLCSILRKLGYEVATALNGEEGYETAQSVPFDFIFMDLQMPVMDGLESAQRILASDRIPQPVYITAFTANARQTDRDACDEVGFHDFVSKPARPNKITEVLKRGYHWAQLQASEKNE